MCSGKECQKKAWPAHKPVCKQACELAQQVHATEREARPWFPFLYLRHWLRPDKPDHCRYWLAGLVSALETCSPAEANLPLSLLLLFLWKYTWACIPQYLRQPLLAGIRALQERLAAALQGMARTAKEKQGAVDIDNHRCAARLHVALLTCSASEQVEVLFKGKGCKLSTRPVHVCLRLMRL